jgi:hypothetical protein
MKISFKNYDKLMERWDKRIDDLSLKNPPAALAVSECKADIIDYLLTDITEYSREFEEKEKPQEVT